MRGRVSAQPASLPVSVLQVTRLSAGEQCSAAAGITHTLWRQRWAHCWPVLPTIFLATEDHLQDVEEIVGPLQRVAPINHVPCFAHAAYALHYRLATQNTCTP